MFQLHLYVCISYVNFSQNGVDEVLIFGLFTNILRNCSQKITSILSYLLPMKSKISSLSAIYSQITTLSVSFFTSGLM